MNVHIIISKQGTLIGVYSSVKRARRAYDTVSKASPSMKLYLIERELNEEPE